MPTLNKRSGFFESQEAEEIKKELQKMTESSLYETSSTYIANNSLYADHQIPFIDKHMNYLSTHPSLDPQMYLSNLRLITRIR